MSNAFISDSYLFLCKNTTPRSEGRGQKGKRKGGQENADENFKKENTPFPSPKKIKMQNRLIYLIVLVLDFLQICFKGSHGRNGNQYPGSGTLFFQSPGYMNLLC